MVLTQSKRTWPRVVLAAYYVMLLAVFSADMYEIRRGQTADNLRYTLQLSQQAAIEKSAVTHVPYDLSVINLQITKIDLDSDTSHNIVQLLTTFMLLMIIFAITVSNYIIKTD